MTNKQFLNRFSLITVFVSVISGCGTTPNKAPVIDRNVEARPVEVVKVPEPKAPAEKPVDPRAFYTVKRGDTLIRIALDYGQSYTDLVAWNNLKNPNDIKVDQVLRVLPPDGSSTSAQTSSVNLANTVEVKSLAPVNPSTNKTGPRGDKRPYSDANLAELQKNDVGLPPSSTTPTPVANPAIVAVKPPVTPSPDSDTVEWIWPTEGKLAATFDDVKNKGIDINGKLGQDVVAAASGKVMYEGSGIRGYGNLVIIKHSNNLLSAYAHNKVNLVKEGQSISKGQKIAEMGNSDADTVKLHFEIRQQGKPVDPSKFLPNR